MANATNTTNSRIVSGLFPDQQSAECAYNALIGRGYSKDEANVLMSDETRKKYYSSDAGGAKTELGSKALEGAATGSAIGGTVGAILGAIAAIGTSVLLPGLGLIVAGPLAAALVGAGAGGLTGGLIGALIGSGIPKEYATAYETGVKQGGIVLSVSPRTDEDAAYLEREWTNCGGRDIYSSVKGQNMSATTAKATSATATSNLTNDRTRNTNQNEVAIPVVEEELQVGKRAVEGGGVRVRTNVTETPVEKDVNLREERVTVDRRPVDRPATEADLGAFKEGTIEVTERAEEPVVSKQARVTEEVVVGKDVNERTETVRDTVRRTDVDLEKLDADTPPTSKDIGKGSGR
jgi:uncharacterized protein (TIGR02271 family)